MQLGCLDRLHAVSRNTPKYWNILRFYYNNNNLHHAFSCHMDNKDYYDPCKVEFQAANTTSLVPKTVYIPKYKSYVIDTCTVIFHPALR